MNKLFIFDLDGTLADTIESIRHAVNITMDHFGYAERSYEEIRKAIGNGARLLIKRSMPQEAASDDKKVSEVLAYYDAAYGKTYMEVDGCYDGMHETLKALKDRGNTIAVLSNKQDSYVKLIVRQIVDEGIVSIAIGQKEGYPTKPDPTVPLWITTSLGFSPCDTVFVGDSDVDVITAKNCGMHSVGCDWGYRGAEVLSSLSPDFLISSPEELLNIDPWG